MRKPKTYYDRLELKRIEMIKNNTNKVFPEQNVRIGKVTNILKTKNK